MRKVKSNEELFNAWRRLGGKVQLVAGIVQNDMEIEESAIRDFLVETNNLASDIKKLQDRTVAYLYKQE